MNYENEEKTKDKGQKEKSREEKSKKEKKMKRVRKQRKLFIFAADIFGNIVFSEPAE